LLHTSRSSLPFWPSATPETSTLSLHDALPIFEGPATVFFGLFLVITGSGLLKPNISVMVGRLYDDEGEARRDAGFSVFYMGINLDRKSTRLNSSHVKISYAVFCLKKKKYMSCV